MPDNAFIIDHINYKLMSKYYSKNYFQHLLKPDEDSANNLIKFSEHQQRRFSTLNIMNKCLRSADDSFVHKSIFHVS